MNFGFTDQPWKFITDVPSLLGLLDGKTENSYSGKPTQVQSPARELEAL